MGIGVEESSRKYLMQHGVHQRLGDPSCIETAPFQIGQPIQMNPLNEIHRQYFGRRTVPMDARNADRFTVRKLSADFLHIAALDAVVQLRRDGAGKFVDHLRDLIPFHPGPPFVRERS
ncbi:hypothetical protein D1872_221340 [compost metagenome]